MAMWRGRIALFWSPWELHKATGNDWRKEFNKFLMAYRRTPHSVTGVSPAKMLFGREIRTKIPCVKIRKNKDVEV